MRTDAPGTVTSLAYWLEQETGRPVPITTDIAEQRLHIRAAAFAYRFEHPVTPEGLWHEERA